MEDNLELLAISVGILAGLYAIIVAFIFIYLELVEKNKPINNKKTNKYSSNPIKVFGVKDKRKSHKNNPNDTRY